jgi:hypothetical protein
MVVLSVKWHMGERGNAAFFQTGLDQNGIH